jgi:hypothetical protein
MQQTRRANEAEFLGNGDEVTQPPEIEIHDRQGSPRRHAIPASGR